MPFIDSTWDQTMQSREEAIAAAKEPACGGPCRAECDGVEEQLGALTKAVQDLAAKIEARYPEPQYVEATYEPCDYSGLAKEFADIIVPALDAKFEASNIARSEALASVKGMELKDYEPDYSQMGEAVALQVAEAVKSLLNAYLAEFTSQSQPAKRTK